MFQKFGIKRSISISIGILVIGFAVYYFAFARRRNNYQFVAVKNGTIVQSVNVTGNTTPVQSLDLAFENGGTIASVDAPVGTRVAAGQMIARLDTSDLNAQLAQAEASVDAAMAKLQSLQAGAQPADIQASQAALAKSQQDLSNMYASISDTLADAFAKSNDAVRSQLFSFFSSPESNNPQLTFTVTDSQVLNNAQSDRLLASTELNAWQAELASTSPAAASSTLDQILANAAHHLSVIKQLFTDSATALIEATNLSMSNVSTYKTSLSTGLTEVNAASTNVNTLRQNIASQKFTVAELQAQLNLKLAGSTSEDVAAQEAQVEQARANAESVKAKLAKTSLSSPFAGIVTVNNAKAGAIASPGAVLVSVISDSNLEIDANVPEVDIGKVSIGDAVDITFDAFPNEKFAGKIFYMDPAQTVIQGVVDYKIKISLDKADPRVRSGLTANLTIKSEQKDNVLILPLFAVLQTDKGNFVETLENGKTVEHQVTLGIHDQEGNVEIASGVTPGEEVVNIGLK